MIALVAVALPAAAAAVSIYDRIASRDRTGSESIERADDLIVGGRIYLTEAQVRQTRNPAVWPAEMRSLLNVDHALQYGEWRWNDRGVPAGKASVRVDLGKQLISVARGGHEVGTAVILYGAASHETPLGHFPVLSKAADYHSRAYDAPMPYAVRLTRDGVAIHGSDVHLGRATHGCIGLPIAFARKLFAQVDKGDEVLIVRS